MFSHFEWEQRQQENRAKEIVDSLCSPDYDDIVEATEIASELY